MKKDLKYYVHLYLGCDVEYFDYISNTRRIGRIESVGKRFFFIEFNPNGHDIDKAKLILRPLSDMTDIEATEVAEIVLGNKDFIITYKGMGYEEDGHEIHKTVKCYKIETYCDLPAINAWIPSALLQIDHKCNDVIVSRFEDLGKVCRDDMIDNPFELTRYLLSKHFDLFGLIESGLAIDKTKI